jgi:hypothetical protein
MPKLPKIEVRPSPNFRLYKPEADGSILLKEKIKLWHYIHSQITGFAG